MKWALLAVSVLWIIIGCFYILYTEKSRDTLRKIMDGAGEKCLIALTLLIGIILLVSPLFEASKSIWGVVILGGLATAKGVLWIVNPRKYMDTVINWYLTDASDQTYRLFGIVLIILGVVLFGWCNMPVKGG